MNLFSQGPLIRQGQPAERVLRLQFVQTMHALGFDDHQMAEVLNVSVRTAAEDRRALGLPVHRKPRERRP